MNDIPRKVKLPTIINLINKRPISVALGLGFTIIPIFIATFLFFKFYSIENKTPNVDYELVNSIGKKINAEIVDIETLYKFKINGNHPTIISYKYFKNGNEIESKFKVLENIKLKKLEIGNELQIKELNGKSIILHLKPYKNQVNFIALWLGAFLIIGTPILYYLIKKLKMDIKLYKFGRISKGRVIDIIPKSNKGAYVHYHYEIQNGEKIFGESFTKDFSLINSKMKGDFIPIFISQSNETTSCIIPKSESLRNNWNTGFE